MSDVLKIPIKKPLFVEKNKHLECLLNKRTP